MSDDVEAIVRGLTKAQGETLAGIYAGFGVGARFRLDEGEHHAPYSALTKQGLLTRERIGGHYTTYALTPLGLRVRQSLLSQSKDTNNV